MMIRCAVLLAALWFFSGAAPAWADVAFVSATSSTAETSVSTHTIASFDASGGNLVLVSVHTDFDGDNQTTSGCTFNGSAMTKHVEYANILERVAIFYLASSATGDIVCSSTPSAWPGVWMRAVLLSGAGTVNAAVTGDAVASEGTSVTTSSVSGTATGLFFGAVSVDTAQTITSSGSSNVGASTITTILAGASGTKAGGSSTTFTFDWTNTRRYAYAILSIDATASATTPKLTLLGVGQ